jgi:lipoprotein
MEKNAKSIYNMINIYIFTCSVFFIFLGCNKKDKDCYEKYQDLYLKRYNLWFGSENHPEIKPEIPNESIEYDELIKQTNDSLQIMLDCAIKQNPKNEMLYLYKMKQLYLAGKLKDTSSFLKTVDKEIVKQDMYFQMSLFSTLCRELDENKIPIEDYKLLLKQYSPNLNPVYKERAFELFLSYLITNNLDKFKKELQKKYSKTILPEDLNDRKRIIENIMMRGDRLIFD